MGVQYVNRKDDTYYLYEGKTKTGKPNYYFSKQKKDGIVKIIPDGYEIYENPNAQVFLRKIPPKIFTDQEIAVVEKGVKKFAKLDHFKIDVKQKSIVIFLPNQNVNDLAAMFGGEPLALSQKANKLFQNFLSYSPMMRFVLVDKESRNFCVDRWCFRGAIDDWITLDYSDDLADLVKRYCPHLARESFYDLV